MEIYVWISEATMNLSLIYFEEWYTRALVDFFSFFFFFQMCHDIESENNKK